MAEAFGKQLLRNVETVSSGEVRLTMLVVMNAKLTTTTAVTRYQAKTTYS